MEPTRRTTLKKALITIIYLFTITVGLLTFAKLFINLGRIIAQSLGDLPQILHIAFVVISTLICYILLHLHHALPQRFKKLYLLFETISIALIISILFSVGRPIKRPGGLSGQEFYWYEELSEYQKSMCDTRGITLLSSISALALVWILTPKSASKKEKL